MEDTFSKFIKFKSTIAYLIFNVIATVVCICVQDSLDGTWLGGANDFIYMAMAPFVLAAFIIAMFSAGMRASFKIFLYFLSVETCFVLLWLFFIAL